MAPLSVDLTGVGDPSEAVGKSLNEVATRVTALWAEHGPFLDELLAHPMPMLEDLEIIESDEHPPKNPTHLPSLTSLTISGSDPLLFHVPILTSFHVMDNPADVSPRLAWKVESLLGFLRSCPLLEEAFFRCGVLDTHPSSDEVVSLPLLRSFTHESPRDKYQPHLLDRLSLPSTCQVVLKIDVTEHHSDPWIPGLPTSRNLSYLSDIRTVKFSADPCNLYTSAWEVAFKIELMNSTHRSISFDRTSDFPINPSDFSYQGFPEILESIKFDSVETLCFDRYPFPSDDDDGLWDGTTFIAQALCKAKNLKTLILEEYHITDSLHDMPPCSTFDTLVISSWPFASIVYDDLVNRLEDFMELRKRVGSPLKVLTLVCLVAEPSPSELQRLRGCVGWVEVVRGHDALNWSIDKYLGNHPQG